MRKISAHNTKVQNPQAGPQEENPLCNCRGACPLEGKCLSERSIVYRARVIEENGKTEHYTGLTKNSFKERYYGHMSSFKKRKKQHATTLSTHIWKLKDAKIKYNIFWSIVEKAPEFNPTTQKCTLCLKEKYHIICKPSGATLNSRSELFTTCRHRRSKLLENIWNFFHLSSKTKFNCPEITLVIPVADDCDLYVWSYETNLYG